MRQLGIGPEFENKMRDHVGKLYDFKAALETDIGRSRGRFDDWSTSDFVAYGHGLATALGRKPIEKDYNHAFQKGLGPSNEIIIGRFGSVGELNEYLGYPNVRAWDKLDFVDWGVRVLQANNITKMTRTIIDELSRRRRGPSETAVRLRFGRISNFNALVRTEALARMQEIELQLSGKDASYIALAKSGELPSDFTELPRQERLRIGAIWQLLGACCPRMTPQRRLSIAYGPSDRMIAAVRAKNPIPAAAIEALAVDLQLFDDIWPSDHSELVINAA